MLEVMIELPWPPSLNTYWRRSGHHIHISNKGREYRKAVMDEIVLLDVQKFGDARVSVSMQLVPPDKRRRDVDNYTKAVLDAITHAGLWIDDEQIDVLKIYKLKPSQGGWIQITIKEIERCAE